jgi:hypothetical protein
MFHGQTVANGGSGFNGRKMGGTEIMAEIWVTERGRGAGRGIGRKMVGRKMGKGGEGGKKMSGKKMGSKGKIGPDWQKNGSQKDEEGAGRGIGRKMHWQKNEEDRNER